MKIGMNVMLWTDKPSMAEHESLLMRIKEWGFDGVEIPLERISDEDVSALSNLCKRLGLTCSSILALDARQADPASPDPELRESAIRRIVQAAERTRALGGTLLSGPLFQGLGRFSGAPPTAQELDDAAATIKAAARQIAPMGIRLALEPLNRFEMYLVNTVDQAVSFVERVDEPNVGLLLDSHHGHIEEADTAAAWRRAGRHIFNVHISENHRGTPGSGQACRSDLFAALAETGYNDWLTIEAFGDTVPGLAARLHLWRTASAYEDEPAEVGIVFIREQMRKLGLEQGSV